MKLFKISIIIGICIWAVTSLFIFVIESEERESAGKREKARPVDMPIAWCVEVCRKEVFKSMHSSGKSWGTSSSSMGGMSQQNTFNEVISYCENIYSTSCSKVNYNHWPNTQYIHSLSWSVRASNKTAKELNNGKI